MCAGDKRKEMIEFFWLNIILVKVERGTAAPLPCVLESSTTFDRQNFLDICASRKLFHYPKMLQIRKTSVYARIWIHSGLISKDKDHENLPVSPFLPEANLCVDH